MRKYEDLLSKIAAGFAVAVAILGWVTIAMAGFKPGLIIAGAIGLGCLALAVVGALRGKSLLAAGGACGCGILYPTFLGVAPMLIGLVLFLLIVMAAFDGR